MSEAVFSPPEPGRGDFARTPELQRFLHRLPSPMARRLTPDELAAYSKALTPQRSPHWIDFRASVPLLGPGIYIAFMMGRERRTRERLRREGQLGWGPTLIMATIVLVTAIFAWLAAEMLMNGLDLMASGSHGAWWQS